MNFVKESYSDITLSKDKVNVSKNFQKELDKLIKNIPNFPYKYRQSI